MNENPSFHLSVNMAMTLDGKVERPDGKWYGLSSRSDKSRMDHYRSLSDALILGKNSIINDNPVIHLRYAEGNDPKPILLLRKGTLPTNRNVFQYTKNKPIILTTEENYPFIESTLKPLAEIITIGKNTFNAGDVVDFLKSRQFRNALLEGGPTLNDGFFRENLVDTLYLTIVPFLIGKSNLLSINNGLEPIPNFDKTKWHLESTEQIQDEIFLKYSKRNQ